MNYDILLSLHDGHLLSITTGDRSVILVCRSLEGTPVTIRLNEVVEFCANNFRHENIILSASVYDSSDKIGDELFRALAQSARVEQIDACKERLRRRDASGQGHYFVLDSSYGCDLIGVCGEISVV